MSFEETQSVVFETWDECRKELGCRDSFLKLWFLETNTLTASPTPLQSPAPKPQQVSILLSGYNER